METFTDLRSQVGVPVTQGRNPKNAQASSFSHGNFVEFLTCSKTEKQLSKEQSSKEQPSKEQSKIYDYYKKNYYKNYYKK